MARPFLLEFLLLSLGLLLFFVPHFPALVVLIQLLLKPRIKLCDIKPFVTVDVAVHFGLI
jgi:hypothetical protein